MEAAPCIDCLERRGDTGAESDVYECLVMLFTLVETGMNNVATRCSRPLLAPDSLSHTVIPLDLTSGIKADPHSVALLPESAKRAGDSSMRRRSVRAVRRRSGPAGGDGDGYAGAVHRLLYTPDPPCDVLRRAFVVIRSARRRLSGRLQAL